MQVEVTEYHQVKTVAARLNVSPVTIYRAIKSGKLRAAKFGEGRDALRVTDAALAEYVAACETGADQQTADAVLGTDPAGQVA